MCDKDYETANAEPNYGANAAASAISPAYDAYFHSAEGRYTRDLEERRRLTELRGTALNMAMHTLNYSDRILTGEELVTRATTFVRFLENGAS